MARLPKRYTLRHVFLTFFVIIVLVIIMYTSLVLRDYRIEFDGGMHLVSKTSVKGPPPFTLDNTVPEKLVVNISSNGAESYDVQISRFSNMAFPKEYRTAIPRKERGLMKGGKTYYVRVRSVASKPNTNRKVHGQWGGIKSVVIKEKF